MKYRIVAKHARVYGRDELRYFALVRRNPWYLFGLPRWVHLADYQGTGHYSLELAKAACEEHSKIGLREEFEL